MFIDALTKTTPTQKEKPFLGSSQLQKSSPEKEMDATQQYAKDAIKKKLDKQPGANVTQKLLSPLNNRFIT